MTWAGVDVGGRRKGFHLAAADETRVLALGRAPDVAGAVEWLAQRRPSLIAVDSPRTTARAGERTRDCERRLAREICGIRWTPDEQTVRSGNPYYEWVVHGLELYEALVVAGLPAVECFPTASWTRWGGRRGAASRAAWSRATLAGLVAGLPERGGQDARDAIGAALTARAADLGRAEALGEILVPTL